MIPKSGKITKQWLCITQELGGGWSRLKYHVKEIGAVVMHHSRAGWRSEFKIKQTKRLNYSGNG